MNSDFLCEDNINFPLLKEFLNDIQPISDGANTNLDSKNNLEDFEIECQTVKLYVQEQISKKYLIFMPHELLNLLSFSHRSKEIYLFIKDSLIKFLQDLFHDFNYSQDPIEISDIWCLAQSVVKNICHHFSSFVQSQKSYENIVNSEFRSFLSTQEGILIALHNRISEAFNSQSMTKYTQNSANLLNHCELLNPDKIIPKLTFTIENVHQLSEFMNFLHELIPKNFYQPFYQYILSKDPPLPQFLSEIPQNWRNISSLYEIYHYKNQEQEFIHGLDSLIRTHCTTFNPFQIFNELNSLVSTKFMCVIRLLANQFFTNQNETFSILLASYIHVAFKSLKKPISDDRLFLFDELSQMSNGYFIKHHAQNLLKRLLNFKDFTFDADLRFAKMSNNHHIISIIEDFKNHQNQISTFPNPSPILTFSLFYSQFFYEKRNQSSLRFPKELLPTISAFESYMGHAYPKKKLNWDFTLMKVSFNISNSTGLNKLACNGQHALFLIALSEQQNRAISLKQLMTDYHFNENEARESILVLAKFSLIKFNEENEMIELNNSSNAINNKIKIPLIPRIRDSEQSTTIDSIRIEAAITRFVKIHPNLKKEDVYSKLQEIPGFSCSEDEYYNSLRNLIKKQIISPLDSHRFLRLT